MQRTEKLQYTKSAIVYIDILGIRNKIVNDAIGDSISIMKRVIQEAEQYSNVDITPIVQHSKPKYKVFSDNIIFAIDLDYEDNDYILLGIVANFIEKVMTECGWLCRGAFTYGDLYIDDDFVWGPGLVKSYELENSIAIYPRIIIDPECKSALIDRIEGAEGLIFQKDEDGMYYLDILSYIVGDNDKDLTIQKYRELCYKLIEECKTNTKIMQKINWFLNYIQKVENRV
ncbi:MAG: hypothetical protein IJ872_01665 [Eubacterium sp.]|nr:hypothetical protein [Eubacterium sp.]